MICSKCKIEMQYGCACGQGFTEWKCEKCGKIYIHHNTNTPKVCENCSKKYNICEKCGKNIS